MGQFSIENFMPVLEDNHLDIFNAKFRNIRNLPEQHRITINAGYAHNLPTIAYEYLQDVNLWWAILMFNGLRDPLEDIKPGMTIRIPNKAALISMLEAKSTSSNSVMRI
jgi:hypothetical protein